jgi:hypothetical protein
MYNALHRESANVGFTELKVFDIAVETLPFGISVGYLIIYITRNITIFVSLAVWYRTKD